MRLTQCANGTSQFVDMIPQRGGLHVFSSFDVWILIHGILHWIYKTHSCPYIHRIIKKLELQAVFFTERVAGDWRGDLMASRDLSDREKQGYGFLLAWFESWRLGGRLTPSEDTARQFWRLEVLSKPRKGWQEQQWAEAMRWYIKWLSVCRRQGRSLVSVAERARDAVERTGARRGLAIRTRKSYGAWVARYAAWAGSRERIMDTSIAREWLTELVASGKVGYQGRGLAFNHL